MRLYDAHCHIATFFDGTKIQELKERYTRDSLDLIVVSTSNIDAPWVRELGQCDNVVPFFGVHPWYSHLFSFGDCTMGHYAKVFKVDHVDEELLRTLPRPTPIGEYIETMRRWIRERVDSGRSVGVGEIGLDKLFRIPKNGFFDNPVSVVDGELVQVHERVSQGLSKYRVDMQHQKRVFQAMLDLAREFRLPVSVHSVKAHGAVFETIANSTLTSPVCLHSYTGSVDQAKMWVRSGKTTGQCVYFSLSSFINLEKQELEQLLEVLPLECLLSETDCTIDSDYDVEEGIRNVLQRIAQVKNLPVDEVSTVIAQNYKRFLS